MDDYRETIWGIHPGDRKWFQLFTLVGGVTGSVLLALLELEFRSQVSTPSETARIIVLGIGASFVASGFISWGLLQAREIMSSVADWIREATKRRRERWIEESREEGRRQGREEVLREIYGPNYSGSAKEEPSPSPDADNGNQTKANDA